MLVYRCSSLNRIIHSFYLFLQPDGEGDGPSNVEPEGSEPKKAKVDTTENNGASTNGEAVPTRFYI